MIAIIGTEISLVGLAEACKILLCLLAMGERIL